MAQSAGRLPALGTVHAIFTRWWQDGSVDAIHNDLRDEVRRSEGRDTDATAATTVASAT
ncbi:hypothetical protein [Streptomyces sp. NPDC012616]|uniref:hypothetical protein n=1 Tax=Streptomyces sp. NPDC012616 TaxID=3364840 RepID=UPI0036E3FA16